MKSATFFAPAILCAIMSFQAMVIAAQTQRSWSQSLFYVSLPACFLLMAGALIRMSRDLSRLRRRIAKLEGRAAPDSRPEASVSSGHAPSSEGDPHDPGFHTHSHPPSADLKP
jgi:hypothetical protein